MKKYFFAFLTALIFVTANTTFAFSDIADHPAEEAIQSLAQEGIIATRNADGSERERFFPNEAITRIEFVKIVVEKFLQSQKEEVRMTQPEIFLKKIYRDVPFEAWYFELAHIATALDILQPQIGRTLGIKESISPEEALEMLIQIVPEISNMESAWEQLCLSQNIDQQQLTRGNAALLIQHFDHYIWQHPAAECENGESSEDSENINMEQNMATVEVLFVADANRSIPKNATRVPFLELLFTAPSDQDIEITEINIARRGLGLIEDIEEVNVYVGFKNYGSGRSFSRDDQIARLNLSAEPIMIPSGSSARVTITANMDAQQGGGEHAFYIQSATDITLIDAQTGDRIDIAGEFPLNGEQMRTVNVSAGSLAVEMLSVANTNLRVGEREAELARFRLEETSGQQAVFIRGLFLHFDASELRDDGITNIFLESGNTNLSSPEASLQNGIVFFNLQTAENPNGYKLEKGESKIFRVYGDIESWIGRSLEVEFENGASDILTKSAFLEN